MYSRLSSVYTCVYLSVLQCLYLDNYYIFKSDAGFWQITQFKKNQKRYVWTDDALREAHFKIKTPFSHMNTDNVKKIRLTLDSSVVYGNVLTAFQFQFSFC